VSSATDITSISISEYFDFDPAQADCKIPVFIIYLNIFVIRHNFVLSAAVLLLCCSFSGTFGDSAIAMIANTKPSPTYDNRVFFVNPANLSQNFSFNVPNFTDFVNDGIQFAATTTNRVVFNNG
jgi:hypothetical protein